MDNDHVVTWWNCKQPGCGLSRGGNVTSWQRMEINDDWWCSKAQVLDSCPLTHGRSYTMKR